MSCATCASAAAATDYGMMSDRRVKDTNVDEVAEVDDFDSTELTSCAT